MAVFKMAVVCPNCDELVEDEFSTVDYTTNDGVVCLNLFSQTHLVCEHCQSDIYIGDVEDIIEYDAPEDDES